MKDMSLKDYTNKVLTGMSTGVIVSLVPPALLGEIAKALDITVLIGISSITQFFLSAIIGLCIAMQFKLSPMQVGTVAITTAIGSGAVKLTDVGVKFVGLGDVINAGLTAALAVYLILLIGNKLKAYTILVLPTIVITVGGLVGLFTLEYVSFITTYIGEMVNLFTQLQPVLMGILIAVTFAFLITSPVSSVGVATAIGLTGVASGAANLGATAAGFGLAISGFGVNGFATSIAHIFGSPKLQMANLARKPQIIFPSLAIAAFLGGFAGIFEIQGTPISAGFGLIGLIGPINHLNIVGWGANHIGLMFLLYFILPTIIGIFFKWVFLDKSNILNEDDYLLDIQ